MEHKWGRNVFEVGLAGVGATLAARYLLDPVATWYLTNEQDRPGHGALWRLPNTGTSDQPYLRLPIVGAGGFPWGIAVEPDEPM